MNGDIFTKTELEARQVQALRQRNLPYDEKDLQGNDATLKKALVEVTPEILVNSIDELLLLQRGRELGYKLSDEQFQQILENIKKENKIETDAQFQQALEQEGLTMAQFRHQIEQQLIINRVQQVEVAPKLSISEEEAKRYYDTHKSDFMSESTVTLREILDRRARDEGRPDERGGRGGGQGEGRGRPGARRGRRGLREGGRRGVRRAVEGERRADRAHQDGRHRPQLPQDPRGDEGRRRHRSRSARRAASRSSSSSRRRKVELQPFDKARDLIADKVYASKQRTEMAKYIEKLRDQAIIEWKNEDLKKMYDQYLASHKIAPEDVPAHRG